MKYLILLFFLLLQDAPAKIKIGIYSDVGALRKSIDLTAKAFAQDKKFVIREFKAKDDFHQFDVIVFPGGSGGGTSKSLGTDGKKKVRAHLAKGKGVIGICAGAYLMLRDGGLPLVDGELVDGKHWWRGTGEVKIKISKSNVFQKSGTFPFHYENGPLIRAANDPELPDYTPLAVFLSDMAQNHAPRGKMPGTHAIVASESGKGRIVLFSAHPEESKLESLLQDAARWSLARKP